MKYFLTMEFPASDNALDGSVEFVEVEAKSKDDAVKKARRILSDRIRVNRIKIVD